MVLGNPFSCSMQDMAWSDYCISRNYTPWHTSREDVIGQFMLIRTVRGISRFMFSSRKPKTNEAKHYTCTLVRCIQVSSDLPAATISLEQAFRMLVAIPGSLFDHFYAPNKASDILLSIYQ